MIPVRAVAGERIAVLGLGRSGLAAAAALAAGGAHPICWDDLEHARDSARAAGHRVEDLSTDAAWADVTRLIVSPGIPHLYPQPHPIVAKAIARGVALDNDIGLFFQSWATDAWDRFDQIPRVVCITGSNGKSTTTALVHHILTASGRPSQIGGNIGTAVLSLDPAADGDVAVLELSSYQIELARSLTPDIAVFLNLTPDHLDRHGGLGGYFAAKRRLFAEGGPERAVIGVDEIEGRLLAMQLAEGDRVIRISAAQTLKTGWSVAARRGFLAEWRRGRQVATVDLRQMAGLPGSHNHQNACAAYAVARSLGMGPRDIETAMARFGGLPHRAQTVAEAGGVRYVNDSKATNADAAARSLAAFPSIRWIAGGRPKEGGLKALAGHLSAVRKAYLIGEAADEFALELPDTPHVLSRTLEAAVRAAMNEAEPGDTVLLAPACAAFDQFPNFEVRGEAYTRLVRDALAQ